MLQHRPSAFDPRHSAIADQLRAIEKQLGGISKSAGDRAAATASSASTQFAEAIGPILSDVLDRFRRGQKLATDEAAFKAWTESDQFRKAHAQGGKTVQFLMGPPRFVGWQAVAL